MRELMPEMWMGEEEETSRNILTWPRGKVGPVTDILQGCHVLQQWWHAVKGLPTDGGRIHGVSGDHYKVLPGF